jgi:transportin-3
LLSWVKTKDIGTENLCGHPIVDICFQALRSDDFFDIASDVVCEILFAANDSMLDTLLFKVSDVLDLVSSGNEEEEKQRNITRIMVCAGERFLPFIDSDVKKFAPLLNAIANCCAYEDLDVVQISFNFWYDLTYTAEKSPNKQAYISVYRRLFDALCIHLRYPDDLSTLTAEQRDDFRDFRHVIGDVLKDCCIIIGENESLGKAYEKLHKSSLWQDIEASLFSLRALGSEVSNTESTYLPLIMRALPGLMNHSKVKYAGVLVVGRYSNWTRYHPEFIGSQLQYISSGFSDDSDPEVSAASALALKYLCLSCGELLIAFLKDLHPFYMSASEKLPDYDVLELTEAMAHILNALPLPNILECLNSFCYSFVKQLHEIAFQGSGNDHIVCMKKATRKIYGL